MTANKVIRLITAFWQESIKRVPYVLLVLLALTYFQSVRNTQILRDITVYNKSLSQQALNIAKENAAHIDCVAVMYSNGMPVKTDDLNKCVNRRIYR